MKYVEDHWEFNGHNRVLAIAFGLSPIWLLALLFITNPHVEGGMIKPTAEQVLATQRIQLVVFGLVSLLTLAGTVVLWRARSARAASAAALLLTLPALFLFMLAPAFVLILGNLAAPSGG
jgi:hypothetical protein